MRIRRLLFILYGFFLFTFPLDSDFHDTIQKHGHDKKSDGDDELDGDTEEVTVDKRDGETNGLPCVIVGKC